MRLYWGIFLRISYIPTARFPHYQTKTTISITSLKTHRLTNSLFPEKSGLIDLKQTTDIHGEFFYRNATSVDVYHIDTLNTFDLIALGDITQSGTLTVGGNTSLSIRSMALYMLRNFPNRAAT